MRDTALFSGFRRPALCGAGVLALLLLGSGCSEQPDLPTMLGAGLERAGGQQAGQQPQVKPAAGCPNDEGHAAQRRPANT